MLVRESMVGIMIKAIGLSCALLLLVVPHSPARGQSLARTSAYIFSGGNVDVNDMKEVDHNIVQVPGYMWTPTFYMPPVTVRVNPPRCEAVVEVGDKRMYLYFNNVIPRETKISRSGMNV